MSKVKSYGLKAYVSNAFDLCVGKRIKYAERGEDGIEHIYEVKQMFPFCFAGRYLRSHKNLPLLQQIKLDVKGN